MVVVEVPSLPALPPGVDLHVVALTGRLLEVSRQTLMAQDWLTVCGARTSAC